MDRLRRVVEHYQQTHGDVSDSWLIDVVTMRIVRGNKPLRIELIENTVGET